MRNQDVASRDVREASADAADRRVLLSAWTSLLRASRHVVGTAAIA
jgi:hypothetical protein